MGLVSCDLSQPVSQSVSQSGWLATKIPIFVLRKENRTCSSISACTSGTRPSAVGPTFSCRCPPNLGQRQQPRDKTKQTENKNRVRSEVGSDSLLGHRADPCRAVSKRKGRKGKGGRGRAYWQATHLHSAGEGSPPDSPVCSSFALTPPFLFSVVRCAQCLFLFPRMSCFVRLRTVSLRFGETPCSEVFFRAAPSSERDGLRQQAHEVRRTLVCKACASV